MTNKFDDYLPGDYTPKQRLARILRVNHAGEYGAKCIYEGQLSTLKNNSNIEHMLAQELEHLEFFEEELRKNQVRPTVLSPLWHFGGFLMGKVTAMMGNKAAMACTEAVEEVIDEHYQQQISSLKDYDQDLAEKLEKFRLEELEHRDHAVSEGAKDAPLYPALTFIIRNISKLAIRLAKKY